MSNKSICYGCSRREVGCHGKCEDYAKEKAAARSDHNPADYFIKESVSDRKRKDINFKKKARNF